MISSGLKQLRCWFANMPKNPYRVLGVPQSASEEQIKNAYYKLAKQYHPDIKPQNGQKFKQINQAYNTLKDPAKRSNYYEQSSANANAEQNRQQDAYEQYHRQNRWDRDSNAERNRYYHDMFNRMNREYEQDFRRDPFSMKREQMRQMRREYYRNLFWQQHFSNPRYSYYPYNIWFAVSLWCFFLFSIWITYSLYSNLKKHDQMRRRAYSYDYIPSSNQYPYVEEDDQFY